MESIFKRKIENIIQRNDIVEYFTKERLTEYLSLITMGAKAVYYTVKNRDFAKKLYLNINESENRYLVLFLPQRNKIANFTVYFIHGGGWQYGNPEDFAFIGYYFASYGIPCVMPSYRKAPYYVYPTMENDVFQGLETFLNYKKFNFPKDKIVIAGQSSGAHLGALLTYKKNKRKKYGIPCSKIKNFISISGPLDLNLIFQRYEREKILKVLGSLKNFDKANPINFVTGNEKIQTLLIHGKNDPVVNYKHSVNFSNRINNDELFDLELLDDFLHSNISDLFLEKQSVFNIADWILERCV